MVKRITDLFEYHGKINPQATALVGCDAKVSLREKITYQALNSKANQFAQLLINQFHVRPKDLVALRVPQKSIQVMISILGALKAGAAYVPIHAKHPNHLVNEIVREAGARCIVTQNGSNFRKEMFHNGIASHKGLLSRVFSFIKPGSNSLTQFYQMESIKSETASIEKPIIDLNQLDSQLTEYSENNIDIQKNEFDWAYVMYTSGTTGKPKGVPVSHRNLLATYPSWKSIYQLMPQDRHLQMANMAFDVFTGDWVRALCSGGRLIFCPDEYLMDPEKLYQFINTEKITVAEFVPAVLRPLLIYLEEHNLYLETVRLLICGSDLWTIGEYKRIKKRLSPQAQVINSYGLTEATIDSTYFYLLCKYFGNFSDSDPVPIGKPFPHASIQLLGENKKPVNSGEIGEIVLGGAGISNGYLNHPELTQSRFIEDKDHPGQMLYRTGDQGRCLSDGNIIFLGRNEFQTNIDGKRIELPSIEHLLSRHSKIKEALVIPEKLAHGSQILKAYLVLKDSSLTYEEIKIFSKNSLPEHCAIFKYYQISHIPLTANQKVNRKPEHQVIIREITSPIKSPINNIEKIIVELWKQLLNCESVSTDQYFREYGGSSLLCTQMIEELNKKFDIKLQPCASLLTIQEIAQEVQRENRRLLINIWKHTPANNDNEFFDQNSLRND